MNINKQIVLNGLITLAKNTYWYVPNEPNADRYYKDALKDVEKMIKELPPEYGYWILIKGSDGKDYHKCSECSHTQEITGIKNYCAVCGAAMRGEAE